MYIPNSFWKTKNIDYLLITSEINRFWYTGFSSSQGFIVVSSNQKAIIFLDERYKEEAEKTITNCEIRSLKEFTVYWKSLRGKVGAENNLSWVLVNNLKKINPEIEFKNKEVNELRMIKRPEEIKKIKKICQITVQVWKNVKKKVSVGWLETEVENLIIQEFLKHSTKEMAFDSIISSDLRSNFIHTSPKLKVVQSHLLCDFGGKLKKYCSDFTRVIIFDKTSKINELWKLICNLQKEIISLIRPGVPISKLAKTADKFYKKHGYPQKHALGHGIGLEVHERPNISSESKIILKPNMVFTIEPGIYLPDYGGVRVEDVILVTADGCEILTKK